ncbi:MAG TPA: Fe-S protein assembly co-chaperone HscB [Burkholderiales bacterium]|nr:Fe-S protein assembly co-chaperone HscB [Burkholderiales bacterium]
MTPSVNLSANHFELFGLPPRFALAGDAIDHSYRDMQAQVHPDRFANASDAERRVSMQWATRVNEAYQTLKSPLRRATYLLQLHGIELGVETNTAMPADFLMAQMEWREAIEEAEEAQDIDALEKLLLQSRAEMRRHYEELERQIDIERDFAAAGANVRKLMFLEKLKSEIGDAIVEIEE